MPLISPDSETTVTIDERPLHALLDERAETTPDAIAFRFLSDGETDEQILTCGDLASRARRVAAGLVPLGVTGKTVLLIQAPGLEFIEGLFACWYAGAIAVPCYHDMGLVLKLLHAFEAGIPLTFFSLDHFIQRPVRWLRAISRYRAELSGAPNFAFETCLRSIRDDELDGIDLSCWKAAPCGAERIRPETLERFTKRFAPYGFRPEGPLTDTALAGGLDRSIGT